MCWCWNIIPFSTPFSLLQVRLAAFFLPRFHFVADFFFLCLFFCLLLLLRLRRESGVVHCREIVRLLLNHHAPRWQVWCNRYYLHTHEHPGKPSFELYAVFFCHFFRLHHHILRRRKNAICFISSEPGRQASQQKTYISSWEKQLSLYAFHALFQLCYHLLWRIKESSVCADIGLQRKNVALSSNQFKSLVFSWACEPGE